MCSILLFELVLLEHAPTVPRTLKAAVEQASNVVDDSQRLVLWCDEIDEGYRVRREEKEDGGFQFGVRDCDCTLDHMLRIVEEVFTQDGNSLRGREKCVRWGLVVRFCEHEVNGRGNVL